MKYKFTKADRMKIVHEYETSDLSYDELALKYGISCGNTIATWRRRLENSKKKLYLSSRFKISKSYARCRT